MNFIRWYIKGWSWIDWTIVAAGAVISAACWYAGVWHF